MYSSLSNKNGQTSTLIFPGSCATVIHMKRYKNLLLQAGILLFILGVFFFILEKQKNFITVDFSKHYSQNKTIELASFEEIEHWQGNYSYDSERVLEGKSSITFSSWYGKENNIQKEEVTNLTGGYDKGYLSVYVPNKKNLSSLVSLSLHLLGTAKEKMDYDLTQDIHVGWNRLAIGIPPWKKITQQTFSIESKPGEITEVNLDRLWIENTSVYTSDVLVSKSQSMSLRTIGDRTYVFATPTQEESYPFANPTSIDKGSVIVSLIPEHTKNIHLSLNGAGMNIGGLQMNECVLQSQDNRDVKKILKNTSGQDNLYVFLKAEVRGDALAFSVSNNGVDFEQCGIVISKRREGVQLNLVGSYLIDSYNVEY